MNLCTTLGRKKPSQVTAPRGMQGKEARGWSGSQREPQQGVEGFIRPSSSASSASPPACQGELSLEMVCDRRGPAQLTGVMQVRPQKALLASGFRASRKPLGSQAGSTKGDETNFSPELFFWMLLLLATNCPGGCGCSTKASRP